MLKFFYPDFGINKLRRIENAFEVIHLDRGFVRQVKKAYDSFFF